MYCKLFVFIIGATFIISSAAVASDFILRVPLELQELHQDVQMAKVSCLLRSKSDTQNILAEKKSARVTMNTTGENMRGFTGIVTVHLDTKPNVILDNAEFYCVLNLCKETNKDAPCNKVPAIPGVNNYPTAPLWLRGVAGQPSVTKDFSIQQQ